MAICPGEGAGSWRPEPSCGCPHTPCCPRPHGKQAAALPSRGLVTICPCTRGSGCRRGERRGPPSLFACVRGGSGSGSRGPGCGHAYLPVCAGGAGSAAGWGRRRELFARVRWGSGIACVLARSRFPAAPFAPVRWGGGRGPAATDRDVAICPCTLKTRHLPPFARVRWGERGGGFDTPFWRLAECNR